MIQRVLVANRGEIACRILRACREAGLSSVAVYAENDRDGLFRELADESFLLEGDSIATTYLNGAAIIQAAKDKSALSLIHISEPTRPERISFCVVCV